MRNGLIVEMRIASLKLIGDLYDKVHETMLHIKIFDYERRNEAVAKCFLGI